MTRHAHPHGQVVVGADGSERGYAGVRFAAFEAQRRGVPLDIVNVVPGYVPVGPLLMVPDGSFESFGKGVLERAALMALESVPELEVNTHYRAGNRVNELVSIAEDAAMLVLGARHLTAMGRIWTGSTVAGVASRATCPVVVVPATWERVTLFGRVVAGFKSSKHSDELFSAAFALAAQLEAELVVLHAWKLHGVYDDMVAGRVEEERWSATETTEIEKLLVDYREAYPDVQVRIEVVHERPVDALVEASKAADRLVIVKPAHGSYLHHLGSTARGVLRDSRCPVEVVAPRAVLDDSETPLVVEREGHLVP